jgi:flagellar basal-body rod modification protein FlgD
MASVQTTTASTTASTPSTGSTKDRQMLANNFDQFLTLLTTQLKNQNPLDPLDTNQFTQQLVQFASVEQQIKTNTTLSSLLTASQASVATGALNFVGMRITAEGATSRLSGGSAAWSLNAPRGAQATINVQNSKGETVYSESKSLNAGSQLFTWNGRTSAGAPAPEGDYTISVTGRDANGQGMTISTEMEGVVDSVDLTGSVPTLQIGSVSVPVDKVKTMRRPAS